MNKKSRPKTAGKLPRTAPHKIPPVVDLDALLAKVGTPEGCALARAEIKRYGTPMYGTDPKHPGFIVEELPDGTRRLGKFVNRRFDPVSQPKKGAR